MRLNDLAF